jgi:DNA modification methylase
MEGKELDALVADIKDNGLLEPIIVYEDKIIDGRNRYRACELAGVTPFFEVLERNGKSLLSWVISKNLHRRHLDETQRGVVAEKIANMPVGRNWDSNCANLHNKISRQEAADLLSVSKRTVDTIAAVKREAPELLPLMERGELTAHKAMQQVNVEKRKQREIQETKEATSIKPVIALIDCMELLDSIEPIDLLIADPPYFTDGNFTDHISKYLAKVKQTGQAYVFLSADPQEVASYLAIDTHHLKIAQILVWNYNNTGQRQPLNRYNSNYQLCFYYRGPDAPDINRPADGKEQYACQTVNAPDGRIGDRYHEWQKPIELIERFIRNSSKEGDFVFDPFAGTGTTIIAAAKLGRKALGCDIDKRAIDICIERGCVSGL